MSVDYGVYCGPHIRCRVEMVSVKETGCVRRGCAARHARAWGKFCSHCGDPVVEFDVRGAAERVDAYELASRMREALASFGAGELQVGGKGLRIFVPNARRAGDRPDFGFDPVHGGVNRVFVAGDVAGDAEREVAWFKTAFAEEIAAVREAYGAGNVVVAWGIFSYSY